MKFIFNKKILILFTALVLIAFFGKTVFAVWNNTFYNPGDTLDPECLPTDVDCDVLIPVGHDAVTLGTANGLSLSTQALSLALASTSTTGALSDTDWDIFNNKQDALVSGTNIKTINSVSLLGSGDISLASATAYTLAGVSLLSTDATKSLYTMTSTIPVEFKTSGGTHALYIKESNGYMGLGTTSPTLPITITNSDALSGLRVQSISTNVAQFSVNNSTGEIQIGSMYATYFPTFYSGAAEAMRIATSGNVGIGTTAPAAKLEVSGGNLLVQKNRTIGFNYVDGAGDSYQYIKANGNLSGLEFYNTWTNLTTQEAFKFYGMQSSVLTPLMTILNGGNVGIGTTAPQVKQHIEGSSAGARLELLRLSNIGGGIDSAASLGFSYSVDTVSPSWISAPYDGTYGASLQFATGGGGILGNANGTAKMTILGNGNVGIGTTAPSSTLHVGGATPLVSVGPYTDANNYNQILVGTDAYFAAPGLYFEGKAGGASINQNFTIGNSGDSSNLVFATSGSERMRILGSSGNGFIGIGTTAPTAHLDIHGTPVANRGNLQILDSTSIVAAGVGGQLTLGGVFRNVGLLTPGVMLSAEKHNSTDNDYSFDMAFSAYKNGDANMTERMRIDGSTGNVGIGTTAPATLLNVGDGTGSPTVQISSATNTDSTLQLSNYAGGYALMAFKGGTGLTLSTQNGSNVPFIFSPDSTERMRITSSGNVGIGTTSPGGNLQVGSSSSSNNIIMTTNGLSNDVLNISWENDSRVLLSANSSSSFGASYGGTGGIRLGQVGSYSYLVGGTSGNLLLNPVAGNVGIGTTAPASNLSFATGGKIGFESAVVGVDDVAISRSSAGILAVGTGAAGNIEGGMSMATLTLRGSSDYPKTWLQWGTPGQGYGGISNTASGVLMYGVYSMSIGLANTGVYGWSSTIVGTDTLDTILSRGGAATLQLGAASTTTAGVAQTIQTQGAITTADTAAGSLTIRTGAGTGAAVGAPIYFATSDATTTGSTAQAQTTKMTILGTSGNVGIGTTAPTHSLEVYKSSGNNVFFDTTGGWNTQLSLAAGGTTYGYIMAESTDMNIGAVGATVPLVFFTNGSEKMRILSSGNVGIGTTAPTAALHLKAGTATAGTAPLKFTSGTLLGTTEAGTIEYDGTHLYFTAADAGTRYQLDQQGVSGTQTPWTSDINAAGFTLNGNSTASGNLTLDSTSHATKGNVLINPTSGNVGIGTTAPNNLTDGYGASAAVNKLWVSDTTSSKYSGIVINGPADGGTSLTFAGAGVTKAAVGYNDFLNTFDLVNFISGEPLTFITNSGTTTEKMRLTSAGNLGMGTTAPTSALHVVKTLPSAGGAGGQFDITSSGSTAGVNPTGLAINMLAGYTGAGGSYGFGALNGAAGTLATFSTTTYSYRPDGNGAGYGLANGTTVGNVSGLIGGASGGNRNFGVWGAATLDKASALNVGVIGFGLNGGATSTQVGGYFSLYSNATFPTLTSAALIADNGSQTSPIFLARDNGTEIFRITDGGNVGIGTTAPTNILSLSGTAARTIWMERNTTAATAGQGLTLSSGGAIAGTADLAGGDLTLSSGTSTGSGSSAIHFYTATAGASATTDRTPTEKMVILGSGNVGIGTTAPGEILEVNGNIHLTSSSTISAGSAFNINGSTLNINAGVGSNNGGDLYLSGGNGLTDGNTILAHNGSAAIGFVGVGNAAPGYLLHVGSTSVTDATVLLRLEDADSTCDFTANAGAPTCGSDETLKKNINTQSDNLSKVLALRPVTYNWLTDQDGTEAKHGFIAQEVARIMPELVTDGTWIDGTTRKFLQTAGMTPYIIGAIQELNANLESLTLPTTTENITQTFAERFFGKLSAWLGEASNGIAKIFTGEIDTKSLCVSDDSGAKTCLTKAQLDALILQAGTSSTSAPAPDPTPTPAPITDPVPTPDPVNPAEGGAPTPVSDPAPIIDPAPSSDPVSDPTPTPVPDSTSSPQADPAPIVDPAPTPDSTSSPQADPAPIVDPAPTPTL